MARSYRPVCFAHVVGQPFLVQTLRQAFKTGRIHHAFVFSGSHGVGKTTIARLLARSLNFGEQPTFDIGESTWGPHCRSILASEHVDVVEMDAASHTSVDDVRSIIDSIPYAPALARYRVFIIDEAHMLSKSAFNALLKTLEEPPAHVKFIFATTEVNKFPITVLSRCQRFTLLPIQTQELEQLCLRVLEKEGYTCESDALSILCFHANGSARDALSLLDQLLASTPSGTRITQTHVQQALGLADHGWMLKIFAHLVKAETDKVIPLLQEQYAAGTRPQLIIEELLELVHGLCIWQMNPKKAIHFKLRWGQANSFLESVAAGLSVPQLSHMWSILSHGLEDVRASFRPCLACDMVMLRLMYALRLPSLDRLLMPAGGTHEPREEKKEQKALTLEDKMKENPLVASLLRGFPQASLSRFERTPA